MTLPALLPPVQLLPALVAARVPPGALKPTPAPQSGVSGLNVGFVTAEGRNFVLGGRPFYGAGTNAYYAALRQFMTEKEVDVMMRVHAEKGATVLRVFAHFNFWPEEYAWMRNFGEYNETNIQRLDLVLAAAARHGIRLILVLGNHWKFTGGTQQQPACH